MMMNGWEIFGLACCGAGSVFAACVLAGLALNALLAPDGAAVSRPALEQQPTSAHGCIEGHERLFRLGGTIR